MRKFFFLGFKVLSTLDLKKTKTKIFIYYEEKKEKNRIQQFSSLARQFDLLEMLLVRFSDSCIESLDSCAE